MCKKKIVKKLMNTIFIMIILSTILILELEVVEKQNYNKICEKKIVKKLMKTIYNVIISSTILILKFICIF